MRTALLGISLIFEIASCTPVFGYPVTPEIADASTYSVSSYRDGRRHEAAAFVVDRRHLVTTRDVCNGTQITLERGSETVGVAARFRTKSLCLVRTVATLEQRDERDRVVAAEYPRLARPLVIAHAWPRGIATTHAVSPGSPIVSAQRCWYADENRKHCGVVGVAVDAGKPATLRELLQLLHGACVAYRQEPRVGELVGLTPSSPNEREHERGEEMTRDLAWYRPRCKAR